MSMPSKPRTDEERRAWLQLSRLKGARDRLQHERDQLRQQLMAALPWAISGQVYLPRCPGAEGPPHGDGRCVGGNRRRDPGGGAARRGSAPVRVPEPIIGGRQGIGVIMTRIR